MAIKMNILHRFKNRNAIVVHAGTGINRAIAYKLAQEGANIIIFDLNIEGARETMSVIEKTGQKAQFYQVNITNGEEVLLAIQKVLHDYSQIDYLVNTAGINLQKRPSDLSDEEWNRIIHVNLTGTWNCCRYIIPHMIKNQAGAILNISSYDIYENTYMSAPFIASKGGVLFLTRSLALDLNPYGIRVNALSSGKIDDRSPDEQNEPAASANTISVHELAGVAAFLLSDEAKYITGVDLPVGNGQSLFQKNHVLYENPISFSWAEHPLTPLI